MWVRQEEGYFFLYWPPGGGGGPVVCPCCCHPFPTPPAPFILLDSLAADCISCENKWQEELRAREQLTMILHEKTQSNIAVEIWQNWERYQSFYSNFKYSDTMVAWNSKYQFNINNQFHANWFYLFWWRAYGTLFHLGTWNRYRLLCYRGHQWKIIQKQKITQTYQLILQLQIWSLLG